MITEDGPKNVTKRKERNVKQKQMARSLLNLKRFLPYTVKNNKFLVGPHPKWLEQAAKSFIYPQSWIKEIISLN